MAQCGLTGHTPMKLALGRGNCKPKIPAMGILGLVTDPEGGQRDGGEGMTGHVVQNETAEAGSGGEHRNNEELGTAGWDLPLNLKNKIYEKFQMQLKSREKNMKNHIPGT